MTVVHRGLGFCPLMTPAAEAEDLYLKTLSPVAPRAAKLSEFAGRVEGLTQVGLFSLEIIILLLLLTIEQPSTPFAVSAYLLFHAFVADRASHHRSCVGFDWSLCFRLSAVAALVGRRRYHRPSASGVESSAYALSVNFIQRPLGHRVQCGRPSPLSFAGRIANHLGV